MAGFEKPVLILFFGLVLLAATSLSQTPGYRQYALHPGGTIIPPVFDGSLQIFCYESKPKYIIHIWQSVCLLINSESDNFDQYSGGTPKEVYNSYLNHKSSWSLNLFSSKQKQIRLDPFNSSCTGISAYEYYNVTLQVIRVDFWKVMLLVVGIILFLTAPQLSENTLFYYLSGISIGVCASFLILVYLVSKLMPRKPLMYGVVMGGWAVGVYIVQLLFDNFRSIVLNYRTHVLAYIAITSLISFTICYRIGPVTDRRSKNLIRWLLQLVGLLLVFFSSHFQEASMGICLTLLIINNMPEKWVSKSKTLWKRKFPPKVQLLSNDEYYKQGVLETSKALNNLREYCTSPDCNQWKTVTKLHDVKRSQYANRLKKIYGGKTVSSQLQANHIGLANRSNRFAMFVEGSSHLNDQEILDYESSSFMGEMTEDDEDILTTDSSDEE